MHAYTHVYALVYLHAHAHVCTHVYTHTHMPTRMINKYARMSIPMSLHTSTPIFMLVSGHTAHAARLPAGLLFEDEHTPNERRGGRFL